MGGCAYGTYATRAMPCMMENAPRLLEANPTLLSKHHANHTSSQGC